MFCFRRQWVSFWRRIARLVSSVKITPGYWVFQWQNLSAPASARSGGRRMNLLNNSIAISATCIYDALHKCIIEPVNHSQFQLVVDAISAGAGLATALDALGISEYKYRQFLREYPACRLDTARARQDAAEHWADELKVIADDPGLDPQRARNRIDARKWLASKFNPRQFGERMDLTVTERVDPSAAHGRALARLEAMRGAHTIIEHQPDTDARIPLQIKAPIFTDAA